MLTLRSPVETVRQACLENNLCWLQAFGCQVDRLSGAIRVWHADVVDYRALIITEAAAAGDLDTERSIRSALRERIPVYLDDQAAGGWHTLLQTVGAHLALNSFVRVLPIPPPRQVTSDVRLKLVPAEDIEHWSALYARSFRHGEAQAAQDLRRWRQATTSGAVDHFIFQHQGRDVGTCQLCWGAGVAGLYSVGYQGAAAGQSLRPALQLVAREVRRNRCGLIYFERVRLPPAPNAILARGKRTIRSYEVWGSS
jgi:hypothetical protein